MRSGRTCCSFPGKEEAVGWGGGRGEEGEEAGENVLRGLRGGGSRTCVGSWGVGWVEGEVEGGWVVMGRLER